MKKKILSLLICCCILLTFMPISMAGTHTIEVAEILTGGTLDYDWIEHTDDHWVPVADPVLTTVYRADNEGMQWSIPTEGVTNYRGLMMTRVNCSTISGTQPYYGLIFNYVNDTAFLYVGLTTHDLAEWWEIGWWNGSKNQLMEVEVNTTNTNVSANWTVLKCIYNPHVGHILFKAWDTTRTEPTTYWDIDYTDATNLSVSDDWVDSTTQWGIYVSGTNDAVDFWGITIFDLHYDTRTVSGSEVPYIDCPHISATDVVEDMFNSTNFAAYISAWNKLDQQSFLVYSLSGIGYPKGNVYIFSTWNYTEDKIGFLIYDDNDDLNDSGDWLAFTVDKNHNHLLDAGDKFFFFDKTALPTSYTYDGDVWVAATDDIDQNWAFWTTGVTRYKHTQWSILFDSSSIIPADTTLADFADGNNYVGLGIWGDLPTWVWNNWDEIENATITSNGNATGGAFNDTTGEWEETDTGQPRDSNLTFLGDFSLKGWTTPSDTDPDYIDLLDLSEGALKNSVHTYQSVVRKVNRYSIDADAMVDNNITKIKVPTELTNSFFGIFESTTSVTPTFYTVNINDFKVHTLSSTKGTNQNYSIKEADIKNYDLVLVVFNPSTFDTSDTFFKWFYSNDVVLAL